MTKDPHRNQLRAIASALDMPAEAFFNGGDEPERFASMNECLRLWLRIGSVEGRRKALDCLHAIVDAEMADGER